MLRRLHARNLSTQQITELNRTKRILKRRIRAAVFNDRCVRWQATIARMSRSKNELWKLAKIAKKENSSSFSVIVHNNCPVSDRNQIANLFAEKFAEAHRAFTPLNNSFDQSTDRNLLKVMNETIESPADFFDIDALLNIIYALRPSKAPGLDQITNVMLKKLPLKAAEHIIQIFNAAYHISYWPTTFKTAIVIPIHKRGKPPTDIGSYRPVSLLSSLSKLFERLLKAKLDEETVRLNVLPSHQFGFRSSRASEHQAINLAAKIQNNKNRKKSTAILTFDIAKAFDSVWHAGLIRRLQQQGYPQHMVKLLAFFCYQRYFTVRILGKQSDHQHIPAGLPQGSCLSPLLYNIYTANLKCNREEILTYADDHQRHSHRRRRHSWQLHCQACERRRRKNHPSSQPLAHPGESGKN